MPPASLTSSSMAYRSPSSPSMNPTLCLDAERRILDPSSEMPMRCSDRSMSACSEAPFSAIGSIPILSAAIRSGIARLSVRHRICAMVKSVDTSDPKCFTWSIMSAAAPALSASHAAIRALCPWSSPADRSAPRSMRHLTKCTLPFLAARWIGRSIARFGTRNTSMPRCVRDA